MPSFVAVEVFCNRSRVLLLCVLGSDRGDDAGNKTFHLLPFPGLPEEVGHVEGERLDKEGHPDPLVEPVVDGLLLGLLASLEWTNTRLEHVRP